MAKKTNPTKITNAVDKIVKKYALLLKFMVLGSEALKKSEIKVLVQSGLLDPKYFQPTLKDIYLDSHLGRLRDTSRKSVRTLAIKHLRRRAGRFIDALTDKRSKDLSAIVEDDILIHNQKLKQIVGGTLAEGVERNQASKQMAMRLREKTQDHFKDWDRVVTTELAEAQNLGSMDAIIENNKRKKNTEVYVYKSGVPDNKRCKFCIKFWTIDGVTPRVFKLSELMANGSNMGKKQEDWKPTVGLTHPNCRDFLLELPISWGFKNGALSFISKDHDEYKSQNS